MGKDRVIEKKLASLEATVEKLEKRLRLLEGRKRRAGKKSEQR